MLDQLVEVFAANMTPSADGEPLIEPPELRVAFEEAGLSHEEAHVLSLRYPEPIGLEEFVEAVGQEDTLSTGSRSCKRTFKLLCNGGDSIGLEELKRARDILKLDTPTEDLEAMLGGAKLKFGDFEALWGRVAALR